MLGYFFPVGSYLLDVTKWYGTGFYHALRVVLQEKRVADKKANFKRRMKLNCPAIRLELSGVHVI